MTPYPPRRSFLRAGLTASGLDLAFRTGPPGASLSTSAWAQGVSPPVPVTAARMSLEDFVVDPDRAASLKRGVAAMKARAPSDPTSWFFQAAVHAVPPEWVEVARRRDPDVGKLDVSRFWNQCPHGGQGSADFLVWHRAYLYHFERILRAAAGDPGLALPYWNYTDAAQRAFPEIFAGPEEDPVTRKPTNPLFELRRELAFTSGLYELSEAAVSPAKAFSDPEFFGLTDSTGFAGGVADQDRNTKGLVESRPHDQLHFAIGGVIGFGSSDDPGTVADTTRGLMASVPTAAFDPIFWVHHSNIDRLWAVWDCMPGRTWGNPPSESWFEEAPWHFHDHDGAVKNLKRAAYIRHGALDVRYDSQGGPCSPLSARLPYEVVTAGPAPAGPRPSGVGPGHPRRFAVARAHVVGRSETPLVLATDEAVSQRLAVDTTGLDDAANAQPYLRRATQEAPRRLALRLEGIAFDAPPNVGYDVYVDLPDRMTPERGSRHYVGSLALFGIQDAHRTHAHRHDDRGGAHGEEAEGAGQQFDITQAVADPGTSISAVRVTIAPFELLVPRAGNRRPSQGAALQRRGDLTIARLSVVAIEASPVGP